MNQCAISDYKQADTLLSEAYIQALANFSNKQISSLRISQREWIRQRAARCNPKKNNPGKNTTIDYLTCMQEMTDIRSSKLMERILLLKTFKQ